MRYFLLVLLVALAMTSCKKAESVDTMLKATFNYNDPVFFLKVDRRFALMWLAIMLLILSTLSFWYEWYQFPTYELYGGVTRFISNSKHDIRLFAIGVFSGSLIGFIVYSIIYSLTNKKD